MKTMTAIVLAAGQGKRFKSARSKVLAPVLGAPLFSYPVAAALQAGARRVMLVVGRDGEQVSAEATRRFGEQVTIVVQPEQRGTGHAVMCALDQGVDEEECLILCGDVPTLRGEALTSLRALKAERGAPLAMVVSTVEDPRGYGRMLRDQHGAVRAVVEQADLQPGQEAITEINAGLYLVDSAFLREGLKGITADNRQGELYLPDIVPLAYVRGRVAALTLPFAEMAGVNDRTQLRAAIETMQRRVIARHEEGGVSFAPLPLAVVEPQVEIGPDCDIGPGVIIRGKSRLGPGVTVEGYTVIEDTVIADSATIRAYSHLAGAEVGAGCIIGPFARLRPGTVLGKGAHVGNFVELKNARLHDGVKANHLTYLGDAEVGGGSNVGAGTITCNYDGVHKHTTTIGERCFIGSNATLVAPLTIESGAYIAAGSTITDTVPASGLAFGRARQVVKPGRAPKGKGATT